MEHIFGELYAVPESREEKPYFYKSQVEKVKAIQAFLTAHMGESHTQQALAARFDIPLTTMKRCFKSVFGNSIGDWLTEYRMNQAAVLLRTEKALSVVEIAGRVGYDSPSKFTLVFRKVMGMSPTEYRRR